MMKISEMPKYEVYKDSGVEWLGDIPASWSLLANKHIFRLKKKQVGKRSSEYDLLSLTLRGVIKRDMENPEGKFPAEFDTYQEVRCGDFIFCLFDVEETPRTVGLSPFNGMITGAYTVFELNDNFDNRFLYYFYMNLDAKKMLKPLYRGLRNTIPKDSFLSFKTFVPPHEQQTRIANFLDKKTALIDEAISIKEKQINLLKERKQIIIQQAVTQGLDPNVPMKDSGVDWIGKIPAHWVLKKIKHVTSKIGSGVTPTGGGSTYLDDGIPLLRSQNIHFDRIDLTDVARISNKTHEGMSNSKVKKGDVLLNITGGSIGRCYYVDSSDEMNVNQHVCIVRPNKIIKTVFLNAVLASEIGQGQIWYFQQGGGREGLNFQALKNFYIALPPEAQQVEIAEYIDELEKEFYSAIQIQLMQIEKLKEYKTTLINSAVTGKIKITPEMVEQ
ncbi:restriction endonuclease subunit S [Providencia rettgeri]|nr:restriction endonuclease subunit S [Providencia rettgeri]ELQ1455149.1 restriction endonuclease subunit S [Providencia rettgeri]HEM8307722.1 restriction endonuclease subunit S [Providencia rettgeri]